MDSAQNDSPIKDPHGIPADRPSAGHADQAAEMIRKKIDTLYTDEPNVELELASLQNAPLPGSKPAIVHPVKHQADKSRANKNYAESERGSIDEDQPSRSKHQQFMFELSRSGKALAEIQADWHDYYTNLPSHEKHEVWQEFYSQTKQSNPAGSSHTPPKPQVLPMQHSAKQTKAPERQSLPSTHRDQRTVSDIKKQINRKVRNRSQKKSTSHLKSLIFGLGMGAAAVAILLVGFFNERFVAPFITPSRTVSNTPIIADPDSTAVGSAPRVIIPKINVDIPVVYDEPSIEEEAVQKALERGVVHYGTTTNPGELGNAVIFGHSSNNLFNPGRYKFAFVLLNRMEQGDTFMLEKDGKRYVYKVFEKKVVPPTDLSVLEKTDRPATATLITCDPPGTIRNRLVVIGEQISPDPSSNVASAVNPAIASQPEPVHLPGDAPSLWQRIMGWIQS